MANLPSLGHSRLAYRHPTRHPIISPAICAPLAACPKASLKGCGLGFDAGQSRFRRCATGFNQLFFPVLESLHHLTRQVLAHIMALKASLKPRDFAHNLLHLLLHPKSNGLNLKKAPWKRKHILQTTNFWVPC